MKHKTTTATLHHTLSCELRSAYGMHCGRSECSNAQNASPSFQLLLKFVMSIPCQNVTGTPMHTQ